MDVEFSTEIRQKAGAKILRIDEPANDVKKNKTKALLDMTLHSISMNGTTIQPTTKCNIIFIL